MTLRQFFCTHSEMVRERDAHERPEFHCACGHRELVVTRTDDQWARQRSGVRWQTPEAKVGTRTLTDNVRSFQDGQRRRR